MSDPTMTDITAASPDAEGFAPPASEAPIPTMRAKGKGGWPKGRPRGAAKDRATVRPLHAQADDAAAAPNATDGTPKRRKGPSAVKREDVEALARQVMGGHMIVAQFTGIPELVLTEQEAVAVSSSILSTASQFGVDLSDGGKWMAMLGMVATLGMVYVPRVMAIQVRARTARASGAAKAQTPSTGNGEAAPTADAAPHAFETMPRPMTH
jgi:hypothetical protein